MGSLLGVSRKTVFVMWAALTIGCSTDSSKAPREGVGAGGEPATVPLEPRLVRIYSWWTDSSEREALNRLTAIHKERYPSDEVKNIVSGNAPATRRNLRERVTQANLPDVFQANIGADLLYWTRETEAMSAIEPLGGVAVEEGWVEAFPESLLELASYEGNLDRLYGVPLNLHRLNALFYSPRVFAQLGLEPPRTLDEMRDTMIAIKASDKGIAPLGLGLVDSWVLTHIVFENVMPAIGGADFYHRFWQGEVPLDSAEWNIVRESLAWLLMALCGDGGAECDGYAHSGAIHGTWSDAVNLLAEGQVAMVPMGDWARGYLLHQGLVPGEDFDAVPFPGSSDVCVFTSDTLTATKGARAGEAALDLLRTAGSREAQVAFSAAKGAVPARRDISLDDVLGELGHGASYSATDQLYRATFEQCLDQSALALSGTLHTRAMEDLSDELRFSIVEHQTIEIAYRYIRGSYISLGWF